MTKGLEDARERRNWLERLGEKIPGFKGYQDRELRRDVDRMQREHLAAELERIKVGLRGRARAWTDGGQIGVLHLFERFDQRLDGLAQAIRFADYGQSGFFDVVKFGEPELEQLYRFDLGLLDDVSQLAGQLAALPTPGTGDVTPALESALEQIRVLEEKWSRRDQVVSGVVQEHGDGSG